MKAEHAKAMAEQWNLQHFETSAKTGENVQELFLQLGACCMKRADVGAGCVLRIFRVRDGEGRTVCTCFFLKLNHNA